MVTTVSGKHMEVGQSLQDYVHARMDSGVKNYLKYHKPMMPKKRKIKDEKPALKQLVMDLGKENPKKENKISAEDDWKLKALEAQLEWIKNSVIPIPSKK